MTVADDVAYARMGTLLSELTPLWKNSLRFYSRDLFVTFCRKRARSVGLHVPRGARPESVLCRRLFEITEQALLECERMAKVTFEYTEKIDGLGKWQQPILDAIFARFPGSKPGFVPLPMGRAGLVVYWKGFHGHDVTERQAMVREPIAELGADALKRVAMIVTLTPEEAAEMNEDFAS